MPRRSTRLLGAEEYPGRKATLVRRSLTYASRLSPLASRLSPLASRLSPLDYFPYPSGWFECHFQAEATMASISVYCGDHPSSR